MQGAYVKPTARPLVSTTRAGDVALVTAGPTTAKGAGAPLSGIIECSRGLVCVTAIDPVLAQTSGAVGR